MTPQPADAGHPASSAPASASSDAQAFLSGAVSSALAPAAGVPDPQVAVAFTLGWQMEELFRPQTRELASAGTAVPGDLPGVDQFNRRELDLLGVAELRAGLHKLRPVIRNAGLRVPEAYRFARALGVADVDDIVDEDDSDDDARSTAAAAAAAARAAPKPTDAVGRASEAAQVLSKLAQTVAKVAQDVAAEVAQEVAQSARGGGDAEHGRRRRETRDQKILAFHLEILTTLTAARSRLGKAYWLGCALAETCLAPTDLAAVRTEFERQRVETMRAALDDLNSAFCAHAGAIVAESLVRWSEWLRTDQPNVAPEAVVVRLRDQGRLWRSLLSGDKAAADMLTAEDYLHASGDMMTQMRRLGLRFLRDHLLLVGLVLLLFVGGMVLMVAPQTSATTVAGLTAVLTAVGLTWKGIGGSLGKEVAKLERPLWGDSLNACLAPRITILPATGAAVDKTSLFRDRERANAHPPPPPAAAPPAAPPAAAARPASAPAASAPAASAAGARAPSRGLGAAAAAPPGESATATTAVLPVDDRPEPPVVEGDPPGTAAEPPQPPPAGGD